MKSRTSLFVIGILIAMLAASLLTVLALFLTGTLVPNKPELEFTVKAVAAREYDGTPLKAESFDWESGKKYLKEGYKVKGVFNGAQTNVGTSDSDLRVKIYDEKDRDVTNEYSVKIKYCQLRVLPKEIHVLLLPQQIEYSGKNVPVDFYKIFRGDQLVMTGDEEQTELIEGHKLVVSFPGQFENVGDKLPDVTEWKKENFKIFDATGNNVTSNYYVHRLGVEKGEIKIVPRKIKVRALDAEKYYDGTPISGNYYELVAGTLVEGEYIDDVKFAAKNGGDLSATVGKQEVKVSDVVVYRQEGYDLVPDGNYEVETDKDNYATFTVKQRPVTITANDVEKVYDGASVTVSYTTDLMLAGYFILDENSTLSMPVPLTSNVNTGSNVFEQEYSFHRAMIIKVSEDGRQADDYTDQFDIRYEAGIAKITPIKIQLPLNSLKQSYTGEEISIPIVAFDGEAGAMEEETLQESIEAYIQANKLSDTNLGNRLKQIKPYELQAVCDKKIQDAGTYTFGVELNEGAQAPFGKAGNVIFDATAEFEVEKAFVQIFYRDTEGAVNSTSKVYDGLEAASALSYQNFVVSSDDYEDFVKKFSVVSANYRYVDENYNPVYGDYTRVLSGRGSYTVAVNNVHIINNETSEDVTKNFTNIDINADENKNKEAVIGQFTVSIEITKKIISAKPAQAVINRTVDTSSMTDREIDNMASDIAEGLYASISFEGLVLADRIGKSEDDFQLVCDLDQVKDNTRSYVVYISELFQIRNSKGESVLDCYELDGAENDIVLITIYITKVDNDN